MSHHLVFVCAMNVCRSPLMAYSFAQALREEMTDGEWLVTSGGTSVTRPESICKVGAELIDGDAAGLSFVESHTSTLLEPQQLADVDMVIVATRAERGAVATMDPTIRDRVFTLREAVALGKAPVTAVELAALEHRRAAGAELPLRGFPIVLHGRRGLAPLVQPHPKSPWSRKNKPDPFDTVDVHHRSDRVHVAALRDIQSETRTLAASLTSYLERQSAAAAG